jgi:hypothetical protein
MKCFGYKHYKHGARTNVSVNRIGSALRSIFDLGVIILQLRGCVVWLHTVVDYGCRAVGEIVACCLCCRQ